MESSSYKILSSKRVFFAKSLHRARSSCMVPAVTDWRLRRSMKTEETQDRDAIASHAVKRHGLSNRSPKGERRVTMARTEMTEEQRKTAEAARNLLSLQAHEAWKEGRFDEVAMNELVRKGKTFMRQVATSTDIESVKKCVEAMDARIFALVKAKKSSEVAPFAALLECCDGVTENDFNRSGVKGQDPAKNPKWNELPSMFAIVRNDVTVVFSHVKNNDGSSRKCVVPAYRNGEVVKDGETFHSLAQAATSEAIFGEVSKVDGWNQVRHVRFDGDSIIVGERVKFTVSFEDTDFDGATVIEAVKLALAHKGKSPDSIGNVSDNVKLLFAKLHPMISGE